MYSKDSIKSLESLINYKFNSTANLQLAITHSSYSDTNNNEILEFLGDAVLQFIITTYLWQYYADYNEGDLTLLRSHLVNKNALVDMAKSLNLDKHIKCQTAVTDNMLEDCFEAMIGSLYLDSCLQTTQRVVLGIYRSCGLLTSKKINMAYIKNEVSMLYEYVAKVCPGKNLANIVRYSDGNDENTFTLELLGNTYNATAKSKKQAKIALSRLALKKLQNKT